MLKKFWPGCRFILRSFFVLLAAFILFAAGVFFYMHRNPADIGQKLARELSEHTGLACSMGTVSAVFFPLPAIMVTGIEIKGPHSCLSVDYLTVRPAFLPLLSGDFKPAQIIMLRPELFWTPLKRPERAEGVAKPAIAEGKAGAEALSSVASFLKSCDITVMNGKLARKRAGEAPLILNDLYARIRVGARRGKVDMYGYITEQEMELPFSVYVEARRRSGVVHIRQARFGLGEDLLEFAGDLLLEKEPALKGHVDVAHLDLARWFSFGRNLPNGLQKSLGALRGSFDLSVNSQGLSAKNLSARAGEVTLRGEGKVESFAAPLVFIDLATEDEFSLESILPESGGEAVPPRKFGHAPLVAGGGGGPGVGYDINIAAGKVRYWRFEAGKVAFRCTEEPKGAALIFSLGSLLGGNGTARLLIPENSERAGRPPRKVLQASLRNFKLEDSLKILCGKSWLSGRSNLEANINFNASSLTEFLTSADGQLKLTGNGGKLNGFSVPQLPGEKGEKNAASGNSAFNRIEAQARLRGQERAGKGEYVTCFGNWQGNMQGEGWQAAFALDGPVSFSSRNFLPFRGQGLSGTARLNKHVVAGRFAFDSNAGTIGIEDGRTNIWGVDFSGSSQLHLGKGGPELKGRVVAQTSSLRRALEFLDITPDPDIPAIMLQKSKLSSSFSFDGTSLVLNDLDARVDETLIKGKIAGNWKNRPSWTFNLQAGALDIDAYQKQPLPRVKSGFGGAVQPVKAASPAKLPPIRSLRDFDLKGTIKFDFLRFNKTAIRNVASPVDLKNGLLLCNPIKAEFYGAPSFGGLRAEVEPGAEPALGVKASFEARQLDILGLTMDRNLSFVIGGQANVSSDVSGRISTFKDLPLKIYGIFRVEINNGFLQNRNKLGRLEGARTLFHQASASSILEKGVLRNGDLLINGPSLSASGQGRIDLKNETLDYFMRVRMPGLPEVPVHFSGSLSNPKRDVKAGQAVLGALGSLGSGFIDVMGGIIKSPLRLFK